MQFREPPPHLRLGTRIAATILTAIVTILALFIVLFFFMPARLMTAYSARWVIATTEDAATAIFQANVQDREALSARFEAESHLRIGWRRTRDEAASSPQKFRGPYIRRMAATIENDLQLKGIAKKVALNGKIDLHGNIFHVDVQPFPPDFLEHMPIGPMRPDEADLVIPAPFEIAIQGLDESWVVIGPKAHSYALILRPWLILAAGAVALVAVLSTVTARRTLRPLERLTDSARNFGRTRKAVPIDPDGLQEFAVVARAMNDMQDSIKRFIDERTHMLAALSHDLRTSLTGLLLDAEEVSGGDAKNRLVAGMEDMERVISATLAFAGDDLKSEQAQLIDLAALLISLCDSFSDRNCNVSYSGPDHLFAICQPVAIKRALTNLIDNAVKYGGCARVKLRLAGKGAAISIADDGPGIPPESAELAFKPFGRLDYARNRESGGVGLGLTIARDIVQSHGGEIRLGVPVSSERAGFEILISLPLPSSRPN